VKIEGYWKFAALVADELNATMRWSYLVPAPPRQAAPTEEQQQTPFSVQVRDRSGRGLVERPAYGTRMSDGIAPIMVSGVVPLPADAKTIRLLYKGAAILEIEAPDTKPTVKLLTETFEPRDGGQTLRWEAAAEDRKRLRYTVFIELDNGRRYPLAAHIASASLELDPDHLRGCKQGRIIVRASDGVWTAEAATQPFALAMKPPRVWIAFPRDGATVRNDQPAQFHGHGWDVQAQRPLASASLAWTLDGAPIGMGSLLVVPRLLSGEHSLLLQARDSADLAAFAEVHFRAEPPKHWWGPLA
jgi:hypothetical protein